MVLRLLRLSFSSWLSFGTLWVLRNDPFLLRCQIYAYKFYSIPLLSFWWLKDLWWYFLFHSWCGDLCLFIFVSIARGLQILLSFLKELPFVSLMFFLLFSYFQFYWVTLLSSLLPSFCLLWVSFAFLFLVFWRKNLEYHFEIFPFYVCI